jgi:hypothetical protein
MHATVTDSPEWSGFWRRDIFRWIGGGCALFVVLTAIAMLFYPGGTVTDHTTQGYQFSQNFFSELGFTVSSSGQPNAISAVLFFVSLLLAGLSLVLFFLRFPQFFREPSTRALAIIGSGVGIIAGICFIGVAFTPANLLLDAHVFFVTWAFRLFPVAVGFYIAAILRGRLFPKRYVWVWIGFAALLILYIGLLTWGPSARTSQGNMIQATGQKVIVYASIVAIFVQSLEAYSTAGALARGAALKRELTENAQAAAS